MISIVIPYMQQLSDDKSGNELRYAIRSWTKNADFDFNIVLVGDAPDWYQGDHIYTDKVRGMSFARAFDIANKLSHIVKSDLITDDFIYTYDDVYLIKPVSDVFVRQVISTGAVNKKHINRLGKGSQKWNKLLSLTLDQLMILPRLYGYETHLPRPLNKGRLQDLIFDYELNSEPYLFSTLYFNEYHDNPDVILHDKHPMRTFVTKGMNEGLFTNSIQGVTYINAHQNAWDGVLCKYMKSNYTTPSKYENDVQQEQN